MLGAEDVSVTRCLTGASPIGWRRVDSPAGVFCIAIGHCISVAVHSS